MYAIDKCNHYSINKCATKQLEKKWMKKKKKTKQNKKGQTTKTILCKKKKNCLSKFEDHQLQNQFTQANIEEIKSHNSQTKIMQN